MLQIEPHERATCNQVVERLKEIFTKASGSQDYCTKPVLGKRRCTAASSSTPQFSALAFDPSFRRPISEEELVRDGSISGDDVRKMHKSQEQQHSVKTRNQHRAPPYTATPNAPDAQVAQMTAAQESQDFGANFIPPDSSTIARRNLARQRSSWLSRMSCGCLG